MTDDVGDWFKRLPGLVQRELVQEVNAIAEELATKIKEAAPVKTGKLRDSVRVRRTKKTLEFVVEAGGQDTTVRLERNAGYAEEVTIGQGNNRGIPRGSKPVTYDYALAVEFGNRRTPAQPFFYRQVRVRQQEARQKMVAAVAKAVVKIVGRRAGLPLYSPSDLVTKAAIVGSRKIIKKVTSG